MKRTLMGYWKQFVGLGTAFAHKYWYDPFFRTELNVIGLQAVFTVIVLSVVAEGINVLYQNISSLLISNIAASLEHKVNMSGDAISNHLDLLKSQNMVAVGIAIVAATTLSAYLITRLALTPARNALNAQKQFIGNIAHELRTPLSIIKTNTEVALFDETLERGVRQTLKDTIEELDRISDIINNLLSLNVLVRPEKIPFANVDLGRIAESMREHLHPLITRKHLTVTLTKNDYSTVWGNATALEQVVMNVLKNAVRYTPDGGHIAITIEPNYRGYVTLTISDSGIGIPKQDLRRIFEPFFRTDQSRARVTGGSGLGLAIVGELVKLHHGTIAISSVEHVGTTVRISLPCGIEDSKPAHAEEEGGEIARDYSDRVS